MHTIGLGDDAGVREFKQAARRALARQWAPNAVLFTSDAAPSLFETADQPSLDKPLSIPRAYATLLDDAVCHRARDRFALLYEVLWRLLNGEPDLVSRASDPAVSRLETYARNVRRDIHKMHAFVRFHETTVDGAPLFTAWFEPQHYILARAVPFFVDRFASMDWIIATPQGSAAWRSGELKYGPATERPSHADDPVLTGLWATYYKTAFNPARVRIDAMVKEMPKHYWHNLPEAALIGDLIRNAGARETEMIVRAPDQPPLFADKAAATIRTTLPKADAGAVGALRHEASGCTRCPLFKNATQTVFGEGPADSPVMVVGEQPGDQEDLAGRPFVGPAGQMLDRALRAAGIDRSRLYVTNAVKHFKYEARGKRRIHAKPNAGEITSCRWWLEREIEAVNPQLIVALGATAAQALNGRALKIGEARGKSIEFFGRAGLVTVHPSYLLRLPDKTVADTEYAAFVRDLARAAQTVAAVRLAA